MSKIIALVIMFALFAAGCASNPQAEQQKATQLMQYKIHVYGPACEKLGFTKDTDPWRECIQREYEQTLIMRQPYNYWDYPYVTPYYGRPYYRR